MTFYIQCIQIKVKYSMRRETLSAKILNFQTVMFLQLLLHLSFYSQRFAWYWSTRKANPEFTLTKLKEINFNVFFKSKTNRFAKFIHKQNLLKFCLCIIIYYSQFGYKLVKRKLHYTGMPLKLSIQNSLLRHISYATGM